MPSCARANCSSSARSRAANGGTRGQVAQEAKHFGRVLRHLGRHRVMAVRIEAEQRGQFGAQGQNAVDVATVVQGLVAELGRTLRWRGTGSRAGRGLRPRSAPAGSTASAGSVSSRSCRPSLPQRAAAFTSSGRPCSRASSSMNSDHASVASSTFCENLADSADSSSLIAAKRCCASGASSAPPSRKSRSVLSSTLRRASSKCAASGLAASAWYWRYSARFWPSALAKRVTRGRLLL